MSPNRVIIDTDVGSDIDDAMALALAMKSDEIYIEGVTTVYGDTLLRAKLAKKLLTLGNAEEVKVYPGIELPLLHNREVWMAGHEGDGVLEDYETLEVEAEHGVDFIIRTIMDNPHEITLIPIGPLTNIAAAIIREPKVAENVKEIILMGGVTRLGDNGLKIRQIEHNIKSDPEAASLVFRSQAKITMVGLDVTMKVKFTKSERDQLKASGLPLNDALVKMLDRWFDFIEEDFTLMHDPLTVSLLLDRSLVKTEKVTIEVEYDHRHPTGQTVATYDESGNVDLCLDVDSERFNELLLGVLLKGK